MRKTILLLTMLFCVVGGLSVSAQTVTHYKPGVRKSTFAVNDLVFIYNTASDGYDRRGFLSKSGNSLGLIKDSPLSSASNFHLVKASDLSVWKMVTAVTVNDATNGAFIKLSLKSVSTDTYLGHDGSTNNSTEQFLYLQEWSVSSASKGNINSEKEDGTVVAHSALTSSDNVFSVAKATNISSSSEDNSNYWNGNSGSFTRWQNAHPYAFYAVEDCSEEYQALLAAAQTELTNLITSSNEVLTTAGYTTTVTPVTFNESNLTTNADQNTGGEKDGDGLAALYSNDASKYWHSSWQDAAQNPQDWHYLQVDAGELIDGFRFSYTTRDLGEQSPTSFEIQASTDGTTYEYVITLDDTNDWMPGRALTYQKASVTYESYDIPFQKQYRYVRFLCKKNASGTTLSGYPIFALSKFSFSKVSFSTTSTTTVGQKLRYARLKKAISLADAADEKTSTTCFVADVNAVKNTLDTYKTIAGRSAAMIADGISLNLTTDKNNPNLYYIKCHRDGNMYFKYKSRDEGMIRLEASAEAPAGDFSAYWFFMENLKTGGINLYTYSEPEAAMGYRAVADGNSKLTTISTSSDPIVGYDYEVVAISNTNYPIALKPLGYSTYVSNHGGVSNRMGFWTGTDSGTGLALTEATSIENAVSLIELAELYKNAPIVSRVDDSYFATQLNKLDPSWKDLFDDCIGGTKTALFTNANTVSDSELITLISKMNTNKSSLASHRMYQPATGKFYRFKSVKHNKKRLCSNVSNGVLQCGDATDNGRESIFYLTADNKLVAYVEGQYIGWNKDALANVRDAGYVTAFGCGIDYASYTIATVDGSTQRAIYCDGATWNRGNLTNNAHTDTGYDWVIEEVPFLPVGVNTRAGYGTLYSPVALEQSHSGTNRIKAYTGAVADGVLKLTPIEGTIPQNTPVIFEYLTGAEGAEGNQNVFLGVQADVEGDAYANNGTNGYLSGQFVTTAKAADASIYTLQNKSTHGIGMYKYNGANIQGFRAYLPYTAPAEGGALRIVFDDVTTGIEGIEVNDGGKTAIYDLSGRRVSRMTKGFYIVNGKKVFIK
ncbi:MAG: discoidin domain-containing protein [Prevotellamassilia sp.]|nr:discoidin domain-containing protein [Prevotellamassilia sp.]